MFRNAISSLVLCVAVAALLAPVASSESGHRLTQAQVRALGAKTEAIGFRRISRYLVQQAEGTPAGSSTADASAAAQTEAIGFSRLTRYQVQHAAASPLTTSSTSFAWRDALIGAGFMAGLVLLAAAAVLAVQKRSLMPRPR